MHSALRAQRRRCPRIIEVLAAARRQKKTPRYLTHYIPQRCGNRILKFYAARLPVDLQWHHVDFSVVEFNPGQMIAIGAKVHRLGVGDDLFLVHPVTDTVENGSRYTYMPVGQSGKELLNLKTNANYC